MKTRAAWRCPGENREALWPSLALTMRSAVKTKSSGIAVNMEMTWLLQRTWPLGVASDKF
jgi:hypothetical protein